MLRTDLCGPNEVEFLENKMYVLVFVGDFTRKTSVYFLKEKSETFGKSKEFKAFVKKQSGF